jgi:Holliday junction resolvase-like predicted endonuclease
MKPKDALGKYGEELAARYLSKNGMVILERN